jgi:predicted kinase
MTVDRLPLLILVTGAYAVGKTTLAHRIGRALSLPVLSRDDVYGGLMATAGYPEQQPGSEVSRRGVAIFYSTVRHLLESGVSVVAEQGFRRGVSEADLLPLTRIARARLVSAHTSADESIRRFEERASRDAEVRSWRADKYVIERMRAGAVRWDRFEAPLALEGVPVLRVDTTDGYDPSFESILAFVTRG